MIRSSNGDEKYWAKYLKAVEDFIPKALAVAQSAECDKDYLPLHMFTIAQDHWEQLIRQYSAGYPIAELSKLFPGLLDCWEQADKLSIEIRTPEQQRNRRAWKGNFDHYIVCFWLVGLGLALDIPDEQWNRLLILIGNEGEDELLDRVIASRQSTRKIGPELLYPEPYSLLLSTINAPARQQASLLHKFVCGWYTGIGKGIGSAKYLQVAQYKYPYWYRFGDENFEGGAYFGRWCIEAVAAVKAFGLDDTLCLGHEHYPGDLLRPDGPTTHPQKPAVVTPDSDIRPAHKASFLSRLLSGFNK